MNTTRSDLALMALMTASVNVSKAEDENYLASLDDEDDKDDEDDDPESPDYRGIYVDFPGGDTRIN